MKVLATGEGHVPAARIAGHHQRAGHEALDGAGPVQEGNTESVNHLTQLELLTRR